MTQRILVVDDEPANVELVKSFLADVADEIRGVTDSKTAEQAFTDFEPDLLLLDLHMPEPDGLEILRRLRSARAALGFLHVEATPARPVASKFTFNYELYRKFHFLLGPQSCLLA